MKDKMTEKIENMLKVYRLKLERAHDKDPYHTDYTECVRVIAIISVLEDLYYYATREAAK